MPGQCGHDCCTNGADRGRLGNEASQHGLCGWVRGARQLRPRALQRKFDGGTLPFEVIGGDPAMDAQMASDAVRLGRAVHLAQTGVTNMAGDEYVGTLSFIPVLGPFGDVVALIQTFRDESAENRMQEHYHELLACSQAAVTRLLNGDA